MSTIPSTSSTDFLIGLGLPALFMFPGQGSQAVGMVQELVDAYPAAQEAMKEADDVLGFGLTQLCFEGPEETLMDTINAQPAILAASIAVLRALASTAAVRRETATETRRCFVAGHSLGEYSALIAANSISYPDGLRLVRERGRLMKEAGEKQPGGMAAILGLDDETVANICAEIDGVVQVANYNCPGQVVISGESSAVEAAMEQMSAAKARKVIPLAVSIATHSPLMQPAAEGLQAALQSIEISAPSIPLIGNTTGTILTTVEEIKAELNAQLTGNVHWAKSVQCAREAGVTKFIEIGPGNTLASLVKRVDRKAERSSISDPESVAAMVEQLSKTA